MNKGSESVAGDAEVGLRSHRLLEMCLIIGIPPKTLRRVIQDMHSKFFDTTDVIPEVLSIHAPPFTGPQTNAHTHLQSPLQKPEEITASTFSSSQLFGNGEHFKEHLNVPRGIELCGLPELCFPDGFKLPVEEQEESFHFLVLTDILGNRQQGVVLHINREIKESDLYQSPPEDIDPTMDSTEPFKVLVPFGICVITKFPYYTVLKDCLSCLLLDLKSCGEREFEMKVKAFAAQLALVPCPPPGSIQLCFELGPLSIVLSPPEDIDSPVIDIGLHIPFLCFKPETVLQIVTYILTERRLVFFSTNWPLLTLVTECFIHYLYPLQWRHPYIPVLANQMLDLVMAPTVFLMGCHSRHFDTINEVEELVLVDVDNGTVLTTQHKGLETPHLPTAAVEEFLTSTQQLQANTELSSAHLASHTNLATAREKKRNQRQQMNRQLRQIFLQLVGNLLRDVSKHLNLKHRVFNKKEFLDSRQPASQPFYNSFLKTDLFHGFLKARMSKKVDAFTRWERSESSRLSLDQALNSCSSTNISSTCSRKRKDHTGESRQTLPTNANDETLSLEPLAQRNSWKMNKTLGRISRSKAPLRTLYLPSFPCDPLDSLSVSLYYTKLIVQISRTIDQTGIEDSEALAVCFYLRGIVRLAQGQFLQALLDFQNLEKINMNFFPWDLVKRTLNSMTPEQLHTVQETEELKGLFFGTMQKHWDMLKQEESVKNFELPKMPLNKQDFGIHIQAAGIVNNPNNTDRLFDILAGGQQKLIEPKMFNELYSRWNEIKSEVDNMTLPPEAMQNLLENERITKVSNPVKTSYGLGRVVLSQRRLLLLMEAHPYCKEIARFRDIEEVEFCLPVSIFPLKILALKIKVRDKKEPFIANLKSERDLWKVIIREMCAGKFLADRHKDPQYIQQALSNIQLINAVAKCSFHQRPMTIASKLAYLDQTAGQEPPALPRMTSDALKHTLHLTDSNSPPYAVDVLLYVPGNLDPCESADTHPKLWCGLSDGRVMTYNAATWIMEQPPIQAGHSKLNCMIGIGYEQVWLGSEDSSIYIIDALTMTCNKRLVGHRNQVSDMIQEETEENGDTISQIYSCSLDGSILLWDPGLMEIKSQFQLPQCWRLTSILLHHDHIWCCVEYSLLVLARDGTQIQEVTLTPSPEGSSNLMTDFLIIPQRDELWVVCSQRANLYIWKTDDLKDPIETIPLPGCSNITCMIHVKNQVWVGGGGTTNNGKGRIYIINSECYSLEKELEAPCGGIGALCSAEDRYVLSGTQDSKAIIWKVD
ncbi:DENN domain-containing protein 3-like [Stegostoma tigrinum]|uniref:DENN domain-containing protein 3-like n=1 Tax=Stegostoma tigrinum TaxID=3053191 RepID=UPI00202AF8D6|nr:DENN domain-containing protein 3-like [Stegostoma tigrinum]